ncbi:MAG TPA: hypothetical protein VFH62_08975, partial [Dehalococcoidia bacterium]|nr:hypothetical protein [Dehalococcoidia bacterium]
MKEQNPSAPLRLRGEKYAVRSKRSPGIAGASPLFSVFCSLLCGAAAYSRSMIVAVPMPPPQHITSCP